MLIDNHSADDPPSRPRRAAARASWWRCPAGRLGGARAPVARSRSGGRAVVAGLAHFNHQLRLEPDATAHGRDRDEQFSCRLGGALGMAHRRRARECRERARARAPIDRGRGAHARATSSSNGRAPHFDADVVAARPYARRPGRDVSPAAAAGRRPEGTGGDAPAHGTRRPAAARLPASGAAGLSGERDPATWKTSRTPTSASRATGCAPSCCRCSKPLQPGDCRRAGRPGGARSRGLDLDGRSRSRRADWPPRPDDDDPGGDGAGGPGARACAGCTGAAGDLEGHDDRGWRTPRVVSSRGGRCSAHPTPRADALRNRRAD